MDFMLTDHLILYWSECIRLVCPVVLQSKKRLTICAHQLKFDFYKHNKTIKHTHNIRATRLGVKRALLEKTNPAFGNS